MNKNVLRGMRCPVCVSEGPFRIASSCWAVAVDEGVEEATDFEWKEEDACECKACGNVSTVGKFTITEDNMVQAISGYIRAAVEEAAACGSHREQQTGLMPNFELATERVVKILKMAEEWLWLLKDRRGIEYAGTEEEGGDGEEEEGDE